MLSQKESYDQKQLTVKFLREEPFHGSVTEKMDC